MSLTTYTGVLHVHTEYSGKGQGTLEDALAAARKNSIDFVILTDHRTFGYGHDNQEGWHDKVLVLCGEEVGAADGHVLAFETREEIGPRPTLSAAVEDIRRQCGTAVSIHNQLAEGRPQGIAFPPAPLPMGEAGLLEIWSFMDEFISRARSKYVLQAATRPDKLIHGPSRRLRRAWDRELEQRMLPMVAGLNIHQRKDPLLEWRVMFPYDIAFQTVCTCIITQELPSVWLRARDMVWAALREGRSFAVNRSVGTEKGFSFDFTAENGRRYLMGEEAPYCGGGRFRVAVPEEAEIVLRHNGQPLFWGTAKELTFPPAGPGPYRVEIYLNRRLWILSNPIRLVDEDGVVQPTVSDVT